VQLLRQRHQIDGLLALAQRDHVREHAPVVIVKEVLGAEIFDSDVQRIVIQQDRAKHGALGIQVIRQWLFEGRVNRHERSALCSPFLRFCTTFHAGGQARKFLFPLRKLSCSKRCRIVRGSTARVNRSACASLRKSLQNFFQPARGQRLELYHFQGRSIQVLSTNPE